MCNKNPSLTENIKKQRDIIDKPIVEAQAGIKIARRNINNLRYADDTTLTAKTKKN